MYNGPSVVVNKSGFFSSLVKGVFGTLIALIICTTALGLYGLRVVDSQLATIVGGGVGSLPEILQSLPSWQNARQSLPPILADALDDREALDYRDRLTIRARVEQSDERSDRGAAIVEVTNTGPAAVSWLTLRANIEDDSDVRVLELPLRVASPIQGCGDWRGPILPGETRTVVYSIRQIEGDARIKVELTGLRVRNARASDEPKELADSRAALPSRALPSRALPSRDR